jgi:hypothetical protein
MALYKIVIHDGLSPLNDYSIELATPEMAHIEAIRIAGQSLSANPARVARRKDWRLHLLDDSGTIIYGIYINADKLPNDTYFVD